MDLDLNSDPFNNASARFQAWFDSLPSASFHPDIGIVDLRYRGCGRGLSASVRLPFLPLFLSYFFLS